jgi:hypothetical protein
MVGLSASTIANSYAVGAALLALWLFVRFPYRGPRTFRSAGLVVVCAYGLLVVAGPATGTAQALAGPVVALLVVFLPLLTFAFWAGIRLLRATIQSLHTGA